MKFAEIKRLFDGKNRAEMVYRYGEKIPERLKGARLMKRASGNRLIFENADGRESDLKIERASLVDCDGEKLTVYHYGKRPLNEEERAIMDAWKKVTETEQYKKDSYYDAMTDCNLTYWQKKRFFSEKGHGYLMGFDFEKGRKLDFNDGMIIDQNIRGDKIMEYRIIKK